MLGLILIAVAVGSVLGAVPGIGGKVAIVLLIPLTFGMDMAAGAVFLVATHAVVHTGSAIPSILFGVPGTGPSSATVVDGFPMTRNGEAARAIAASLAASAAGGVIGALVLAVLVPMARPIVLAFGPAETFLLALLGLTFVAALSGDSLLKGLIVGCFGLLLACVGMDPLTGVPRLTFGQLFLWDGIDIVTAIVAMLAIPEILALAARGGRIAKARSWSTQPLDGQVQEGFKDALKHRWLTIRCSGMGAAIGLIPGLGGDAAAWICYGHAVHSSADPQRFGRGAVEGVIAPEAANNSKEGGALVPTLLFGIPGSSGMALLLGALVMLGIQPGPRLVLTGMDLVWTLIWTLVIANLMAAFLLAALTRWIALVAWLPAAPLVPFVVTAAALGSWLAGHAWQNLILLFALGVLAFALKRYRWPLPPFAIGLLLGGIAETSLHRALETWGPSAFLSLPCFVLGALICANLAWSVRLRQAVEARSHA